MACKGTSGFRNLSIFSFISKTTEIEIISIIAKTYVPRNCLMIYQSIRLNLNFMRMSFLVDCQLLKSVVKLLHHAAFPGSEIAGNDVPACFFHQPKVKGEVMDGGDL